MSKKDKLKYILLESENKNNDVYISENVISLTVAIATLEVDGVVELSGNITSEIIEKLGINHINKGIKIKFKENNDIIVVISLVVRKDVKVHKVVAKIEEKVGNLIKNMLGLKVDKFYINVTDVYI